jgi:hypothetical protein
MELSYQHSPAALPRSHGIWGWVDPRAGLDNREVCTLLIWEKSCAVAIQTRAGGPAWPQLDFFFFFSPTSIANNRCACASSSYKWTEGVFTYVVNWPAEKAENIEKAVVWSKFFVYKICNKLMFLIYVFSVTVI